LSLPSLGYLDLEKIKRDPAYSHNPPTTSAISMAAPPLASPSTTYSGPPPPYSYPSSAANSVVGGNHGISGGQTPGNMLPLQGRQPSGENKDASYPPPRQSLPSINEALSISSLITTTAPPRTSYSAPKPTSPPYRNPTDPPPPPHAPVDPFSQYPQREPRPYETMNGTTPATTYSPRPANYYESNPPPAANPNNSYPPSQPPRAPASPLAFPRPAPLITQQQQQQQQQHHPLSPATTSNSNSSNNNNSSNSNSNIVNRQPPPAHEPTSSAPFCYPAYQPAYSYPPPSTPGGASYRPPLVQQPTWRGANPELERAAEVRKATSKESPPNRPAYGESVKRHLDIFDLETSLNEIAEGSGRALDFAQRYGTQAHQTQRSGPIPGSLPTLNECDDMIRQQTRVLDSVTRIREVIVKQQQALAEQRSYDQQSYKAAANEMEEETHSYADKLEGGGGFAGADAKKRRGRAAPPGRCHSCNRAETPEWRRGPDGARTLCNACGLHYAKLTRKMGNKASAGSSNLRPKESSPSSP
ncbi:MAG: hypothetical protein Q9163_006357, partial [Psora crenata]